MEIIRYKYITDEDYETAKRNGIGKATLENRVRNLEWDIDRAITEPVQKGKNDFSPYMHIAKENGLRPEIVRMRVYRGWSMEKAVSTPLFTQEEKIKKAIASQRG